MSNLANRPVVLDIDRSVGPLPNRLVLPLEAPAAPDEDPTPPKDRPLP